MAPSAWLNRLCSAPGKTKNIIPSWRIHRSRCIGRVAISADSRASARTKPCTGSRRESIEARSAEWLSSVGFGGSGEVAVRAQQGDQLDVAAQDAGDLHRALGQRQGEQLELSQLGDVERGGGAVDQLLERRAA